MIGENVKEVFVLPVGVSATVKEGILSVTGPKGTVTRNFYHPKISVLIGDGVEFFIKKYNKNEKKMLMTFIAHLKNMCKGVTEGHEYKLKICSGHFPMNVSIKGANLEVKNFIGEAVPRKIMFKEGVDVKQNAEIISVSGINKEVVAQTAASIEKLTRRSGFDRRIFQDGIYIIEKDGRKIE